MLKRRLNAQVMEVVRRKEEWSWPSMGEFCV